MYLSCKDLLRRARLIFRCGRNTAGLADLCHGRKIAIVGNAASLLAQDNGAAIDKNDVVIRINKGFIVNEKAQGRKTTVYATSIFMPEETLREKFGKPAAVVWLTPKISNMAEYSAEIENCLCIYPLRDWLKLRRRIKKRPTSGIMLIDYICRYCSFAELNLFGFDFFATNSLNNDVSLESLKAGTPHDFDQEKEFVRLLTVTHRNIHLH